MNFSKIIQKSNNHVQNIIFIAINRMPVSYSFYLKDKISISHFVRILLVYKGQQVTQNVQFRISKKQPDHKKKIVFGVYIYWLVLSLDFFRSGDCGVCSAYGAWRLWWSMVSWCLWCLQCLWWSIVPIVSMVPICLWSYVKELLGDNRHL